MKSVSARARGRRAALAILIAVFASAIGGCALGERPRPPIGYTITGVWEVDAAPFGQAEAGTVPIKVELEELMHGVVDVRSSWLGVPVTAVGHLSGTTLTVRVDNPRVARGLVVAYFNGDQVSGTAEGTYPWQRRWLPGKGTFTGRRSSNRVGTTGIPGVDRIARPLQDAIGWIYPTPDAFKASAPVGVAALGSILLLALAWLARLGPGGRAVAAEGRRPDTRVLTGAKAAGHLVYYGYLTLDEQGLCEGTDKLARFDPRMPAGDDGVRGVSYRIIESDGRELVAVGPDLILIVELL